MRSLLSALTLWSCGALAIAPGDDFAVKLNWPPVVVPHQSADTTPLHFEVTGCATFDTAIDVHTTKWGDQRRRLAVTAREDDKGAYVVDLKPEEVVNFEGNWSVCWADEQDPFSAELKLEITCRGDGRTVTSQTIPFAFAAAQTVVPAHDVRSIFAVDENRAHG